MTLCLLQANATPATSKAFSLCGTFFRSRPYHLRVPYKIIFTEFSPASGTFELNNSTCYTHTKGMDTSPCVNRVAVRFTLNMTPAPADKSRSTSHRCNGRSFEHAKHSVKQYSTKPFREVIPSSV